MDTKGMVQCLAKDTKEHNSDKQCNGRLEYGVKEVKFQRVG